MSNKPSNKSESKSTRKHQQTKQSRDPILPKPRPRTARRTIEAAGKAKEVMEVSAESLEEEEVKKTNMIESKRQTLG